ncbi:LVIS_2131 family protein [Lactobacillus sp. YT155]|uniref:LVIS_2131 family protein n=1 Tax=Lactobacillus sp. YT155 TaxID=3060955 RepID=UPI0026604CA4|nr:LVIS_2131 family protein [Lactobacillus sp. YT155]MDO1605792.1 LVIS_2131 family protein [Lactobacillus sp. YT155]
MGSIWNVIGIIAWIILIGWFVFIVQNVRKRHLKMIVVDKKKFSWSGAIIDIAEIAVLLAGFIFMVTVTFFNRVDVNDSQRVEISYSYKPLVVQTNGYTGYFVQKKAFDKASFDEYTFWQTNAKYKVSSKNAVVIDDEKDLKTTINNYPWDKKALLKANKDNQGAFVAKMKGTYKNNFLNGLGMHAGKKANEYWVIKIPASNFVKEK